MKRLSDILGGTYRGFSTIVKIRSLWPEIAGEVLGSHTEPVHLKGKTLFLLCDSSAWVQQVNLLSATLIPRLHQLAGVKIDKLSPKFSLKRGADIRGVQSAREARRWTQRPDIDPADVDKITDPALRNAVKTLIEG